MTTEARTARAFASLAELRLGDLLPALDGFVFLFEPDHRIADFRAGPASHLFVPPEAFLGRPFEEVLPPAAAGRLAQALSSKAPEIVPVRYALPFPEGERTFEAHFGRLPEGRMVAVVHQVTARVRAEEALAASEERLRQAVRVSGLGFFDIDHRTGHDHWSPELRVIFGLPADAPVSLDSLLSLVHPDDWPLVDTAIHAPRGPGWDGQFEVEHRIVRSNGEVRWVDMRSRSMFEGEGPARHRIRTVGAVIDTTDQREGAEALRVKEAAINASLSAISITSLDGRVEYANPASYALWGFERESEVLGRPSSEFWDDDSERATELKRTQTTDGWSSERIGRRRDGSTFIGMFSGSVVRDAAGQPTKLMASVVDVTARHRAEEAMRTSEERLRALVEEGLDLVATVDEAGRLTFVNAVSRRILGAEPSDLLGQPIEEFLHPDDRERVLRQFGALLAREVASVHLSARVRHRNGTWPTLDGICRDLRGNPAVGAFVIHARDITEQRVLEARLQQSERLEGIGRLAGGIAHDFNNLLTAILGYTELLGEDARAGQPVAVEDLQEIQRAAERARDLTGRLLAFARKQVISPRPLDLNAIVRDSERMLRRLVGEEIDFTTSLAPGLWPVHIDPMQVEQVVLNLAVNARDAMAAGGRLRVETANVELTAEHAATHGDATLGPHVMLSVSDTGTGIAPEHVPRLFEPFFTTKPTGQGTGLGLATVYGIVRQNQGSLRVTSTPGKGSTFRVYFPRTASGPAEAQAATRAVTAAGTETLLVVEDDPSVRALTTRALREAGYRVLVASLPNEALALSRSLAEPIHLLVTDVVMPELSGRALADRLVADRPDLRVLFVSGYTEDTIAHHGVLEEGVNFLPKPFTPSLLRERVRALLDGPRRAPKQAG